MSIQTIRSWIVRHAGWLLIIIFSIIPIVRWLQINSFADVLDSHIALLSMLAKLCGLVGLVLYAINLVLASRARWLEDLFGGLNRVYIAHHITGGIALILVLFHPVFLMLKRIDLEFPETWRTAAEFLLPRPVKMEDTFYEAMQAAAFNAGLIAFFGMVVLLIITFFVKLPYKVWLFTHKFLGVAFMFAGLHVILISSDTSKDLPLKVYLLLWVIAGLTAFAYRTLMHNIFVRKYLYKVAKVSGHEGGVTEIELEPLDRPMGYKPGQFVFISFTSALEDGITKEYHPFSIASAPKENRMRLYVKALGDFTSTINKLQIGDVAEIEGAYGRFTYTRFGESPQIWIAGGIGITPFLSMARSYDEKSPPVDLIYCVVHKTELLEQDALAEYLPQTYSTFRYMPYVFDDTKAFLTAEKIAEMCGGLEGKHVFICGPPAMMRSLTRQLKKAGVPGSHIHSEEFSMS